MQEGAEEAQTQKVIDRLVSMGFIVHRSSGMVHTVLGGVGPVGDVDPIEFEVMPGVKECHRIVSPYKLASRSFKPAGTVVKIGDVEIGGDQVVVMAGPCSVENRDQIGQAARDVEPTGAVDVAGVAGGEPTGGVEGGPAVAVPPEQHRTPQPHLAGVGRDADLYAVEGVPVVDQAAARLGQPVRRDHIGR